MVLQCHRRTVKNIKEYKIISKDGKKYGYLSEYMFEGTCSVCGNLVILHCWEASDGKKYKEEHRKGQADKFLKKVSQKEQRFKGQNVDKRLYFFYREYGNTSEGCKKKCHSNISTLKLGLIDPDKGLDFFAA